MPNDLWDHDGTGSLVRTDRPESEKAYPIYFHGMELLEMEDLQERIHILLNKFALVPTDELNDRAIDATLEFVREKMNELKKDVGRRRN